MIRMTESPVSRAQRVEQPQDARLHRDVERGRRLVGDQQPGPAGEGDGDRDALAHAARELVRERVERPRRIGDAHLLEQLERAGIGRLPPEALVEAHVLGQLPADAQHGVQRRQWILEDHRDLAAAHAAQRTSAQRQEIAAAERRVPSDLGSVGQQPHEREHGDRLAAAALACDPEDLTLLDAVADVVDDRDRAVRRGQAHAEAIDLE